VKTRKLAWQQQAIGILLVTLLAFLYVVARYRHALIK